MRNIVKTRASAQSKQRCAQHRSVVNIQGAKKARQLINLPGISLSYASSMYTTDNTLYLTRPSTVVHRRAVKPGGSSILGRGVIRRVVLGRGLRIVLAMCTTVAGVVIIMEDASGRRGGGIVGALHRGPAV